MNDETILRALTAYLREHRQTITTAESCTGGLLAAEFTRLAGSSVWFESGFVTYANHAKEHLLGVQAATLEQYGAVSEQTVREMAAGALSAAHADYALAISGIAGPTGGSMEKPVGTVWFGLADASHVCTRRQCFVGSRDAIRTQAVRYAIRLLAGHVGLLSRCP